MNDTQQAIIKTIDGLRKDYQCRLLDKDALRNKIDGILTFMDNLHIDDNRKLEKQLTDFFYDTIKINEPSN